MRYSECLDVWELVTQNLVRWQIGHHNLHSAMPRVSTLLAIPTVCSMVKVSAWASQACSTVGARYNVVVA